MGPLSRNGSYGWDAYATWWVNRKAQTVDSHVRANARQVATIRFRQRSFASGHRVARGSALDRASTDHGCQQS
jgi:hypothetical protein